MPVSSVNPTLYEVGILLLGFSATIALICAIMAVVALYRYRFNIVIKYAVAAYICIAVALGGFNLGSRVLIELSSDVRIIINVLGLVILCVGMVLHFLFLYGLYCIVRPVGINIKVGSRVLRL